MSVPPGPVNRMRSPAAMEHIAALLLAMSVQGGSTVTITARRFDYDCGIEFWMDCKEGKWASSMRFHTVELLLDCKPEYAAWCVRHLLRTHEYLKQRDETMIAFNTKE